MPDPGGLESPEGSPVGPWDASPASLEAAPSPAGAADAFAPPLNGLTQSSPTTVTPTPEELLQQNANTVNAAEGVTLEGLGQKPPGRGSKTNSGTRSEEQGKLHHIRRNEGLFSPGAWRPQMSLGRVLPSQGGAPFCGSTTMCFRRYTLYVIHMCDGNIDPCLV